MNANIQPAINCKKKAPKIESSAIDDKNICLLYTSDAADEL